jgi:3-isopropylmalate dehydrogenase
MENIKIAVIPGDGIGKEVTPVAFDILQKVSEGKINWAPEYFNLGADQYHATGEILNDNTLEQIRQNDVILLGAVGDPSVPSGVLERGLLLKLRFELDHFINLRPNKAYPGVPSPLSREVLEKSEIDFVVVREGTEGLYCGQGGTTRKGTLEEIATEVSINTAYGVKRTVEYAFELASKRPRKKLTLVHKHNVLVNAGGLWRFWFEKTAQNYPEVTTDYLHVDAATIFLVKDPGRFDVIVTDNLFGDILTDEAGAITGGIGLSASGSIDASRKNPSMFEPVHGSAPDIAGQNLADPRAAILSTCLLLEHFDYYEMANHIRQVIEQDISDNRDNQHRTTSQIGADILQKL